MTMTTTTPKRRRWLIVLAVLGGLACAWYGSGAVSYATSLRLYMVPSASMAPTLMPGDRIAVETLPPSRPARGELWIFNSPRGPLFVKRVVGLPGETIEVAAGKVKIDGKPLDEPYLTSPTSYTLAPVHLAADEYFMLGDSRAVSNDSHLIGPVPRSEFIGRVRYRVWPTQRMTGFNSR